MYGRECPYRYFFFTKGKQKLKIQVIVERERIKAVLLDNVYAMVEVESGTEGVLEAERKGCGFMLIYPVIDVQETGRQLKRECDRRHVSPRELQEFLGLAALQSVYGWFQGRALPSLDNFYALSCYLGMRMEELLVPRRASREVPVRAANSRMERRMMAYFGFCLQAEI